MGEEEEPRVQFWRFQSREEICFITPGSTIGRKSNEAGERFNTNYGMADANHRIHGMEAGASLSQKKR